MRCPDSLPRVFAMQMCVCCPTAKCDLESPLPGGGKEDFSCFWNQTDLRTEPPQRCSPGHEKECVAHSPCLGRGNSVTLEVVRPEWPQGCRVQALLH